jgi:hypothetical protein
LSENVVEKTQEKLRTNLGGFHDFVVLERIEVVLDVRCRVFLNWTCTEEGVGRGGYLERHEIKLTAAPSLRTSALGLGDTDAEAMLWLEALGLGDGAPCNPKKLEHTAVSENNK